MPSFMHHFDMSSTLTCLPGKSILLLLEAMITQAMNEFQNVGRIQQKLNVNMGKSCLILYPAW